LTIYNVGPSYIFGVKLNSQRFIWQTEANMWDQNMSFINYETKMKTWN